MKVHVSFERTDVHREGLPTKRHEREEGETTVRVDKRTKEGMIGILGSAMIKVITKREGAVSANPWLVGCFLRMCRRLY
jgi:hypothetical protein